MRLLLLTFYFPPDLSAGSFRSSTLVQALRQVGPRPLHIDVFTTLPNRYHSLIRPALELEELPEVTIRRFPLPAHQSGMADQARSYLAYACRVLASARGRQWDGVIATSSRMMTAALGAWIARQKDIPLYLDIRDLFVDTMADLQAGGAIAPLLPIFRLVERRTFQAAGRINVVSGGFLPYVRQHASGHEIRQYTNGIDDEFLAFEFNAAVAQSKNQTPIVLYAGNIGEGQGMHNIIPGVARKLEGQVRFRIIGDGSRREALKAAIQKLGLPNVELLFPMPREQLMLHYRDADFLFLHLNDYPAFHKVLPSKIFEYGATGKRILAGVAGYARRFLESELPGSAVFEPCDVGGCIAALERLKGENAILDRDEFKRKYARRQIMLEMARDIVDLIASEQKK